MSDDLKPKEGYIPKPPSKEDVDEVSGDQALITDEWADSDTPAEPAGSPPA